MTVLNSIDLNLGVLDHWGIAFIAVLFLLTVLPRFRRHKPVLSYDAHGQGQEQEQDNDGETDEATDIASTLAETGKNCIVFYGSQTGTAEDYAGRLVNEGASRFGLDMMLADLSNYSFDNLEAIPEDTILMFVLATYGEGEPPNNAVGFYQSVMNSSSSVSFSYAVFGLGNKTYEHYNAVVRNVDKALQRLNAQRISSVGEADDGAGTTEEDFLAWKETMWALLSERFHLTEHKVTYQPALRVIDESGLSLGSSSVYLGELSKKHLEGTADQGPFDVHNPYIARISEFRDLFASKDCQCLHLEVDISASDLTYQTGDHIAIWPVNPDCEVDRCIHVLGLSDKRDTVISIRPAEPTVVVPFHAITTYDTVLRYYLGICGPVSRQLVSMLVEFAPDEETQAEMVKLGTDRSYFHDKVHGQHYTIAQLLSLVSNGRQWPGIPFSFWLESLVKLQPRYYSISSSSLACPRSVSITAVVEKKAMPNREEPFYGVTTNYLLAMSQKGAEVGGQTYRTAGPRDRYQGVKVPIYIRHSKFRLPRDLSKPIMMIGPGTGVAPFRAFVQERAKQVESGAQVGKMMLFFGCRSSKQDFLYQTEFQSYANILGDKFELITAFSREGPVKVYVQHQLEGHAAVVNHLLESDASIYVCGEAANMARQVRHTLASIIEKHRGVSSKQATDVLAAMKANHTYQVSH